MAAAIASLPGQSKTDTTCGMTFGSILEFSLERFRIPRHRKAAVDQTYHRPLSATYGIRLPPARLTGRAFPAGLPSQAEINNDHDNIGGGPEQRKETRQPHGNEDLRDRAQKPNDPAPRRRQPQANRRDKIKNREKNHRRAA